MRFPKIYSPSCYIFIVPSLPPVIGWWLDTMTQRNVPNTARSQEYNNIQVEGRVSVNTCTTTGFKWVLNDDWEGLLLNPCFESIHCFFENSCGVCLLKENTGLLRPTPRHTVVGFLGVKVEDGVWHGQTQNMLSFSQSFPTLQVAWPFSGLRQGGCGGLG